MQIFLINMKREMFIEYDFDNLISKVDYFSPQ